MTRASAVRDGSRLDASLTLGPATHAVSFSVSDGHVVTGRLDPLVPAALLLAMLRGGELRIDGEVSPGLVENATKVQRLLGQWYPSLRPVSLVVDRPSASVLGSTRTAAFFSGGVDSFHTALRHRSEIDALIFVHGFDIRPERQVLLERVAMATRSAASELGKPLIEVRTDLKATSRRYVPWSWYHGSALASVAHLLASSFGRVYVPGSLSYDYVYPYGSHPLLDRFWSTEALEVIYDGFEWNRLEKTALVATSAVAMRWLRVCNARDDLGYNCGSCEKCLRTMVALELVGSLDSCATLPHEIDLDLVAGLSVISVRDLWKQVLDAATARGTRPDLVRTMRAALRRSSDRYTLTARYVSSTHPWIREGDPTSMPGARRAAETRARARACRDRRSW